MLNVDKQGVNRVNMEHHDNGTCDSLLDITGPSVMHTPLESPFVEDAGTDDGLVTEDAATDAHTESMEEVLPASQPGLAGNPDVASTKSAVLEWPWSGRERNHIYLDFAVYVVLLVVFSLITLQASTFRAYDAYNLVQSVQSTLVEEIRPEPEVSFKDLTELGGLRRWLRGQFYSVMYSFNPNDPDSGPEQMSSHIDGFYLGSTTILGPIRLRQLRVRRGSCVVDEAWRGVVEQCFSRYSSGRVREGDDVSVMWPLPLANVSASMEEEEEASSERAIELALQGWQLNNDTQAGYYRGRLANLYYDDGFVVDLPEDDHWLASEVLELLAVGEWLDVATRALFIEFTLYLTATNLMLPARLVVEVHSSGTVWTDMSLEPINLNTYSFSYGGQTALFVLGLVVAALAIVWDIAILWTIIAGFSYVGICLAAALHIYNMTAVDNLRFESGQYFATHKLGYLVSIERSIWAVTAFVIWFRLLRFTSQLPSLGLLGRTISHALPQVAAFFLISCVIFLAFAQCFFMAYYASVPGYQSFHGSIMSVFRFTVLDFDYKALSEENRILTPILFSLLLIIVFFIWVNVMVAIISEVYQNESDGRAKLAADEGYETMTTEMKHPQNDHGAMVAHHPVRAVPGGPAPHHVALHPEQFWRVRLGQLGSYTNLVTVDMHAHFAALASGAGGKTGSPKNPKLYRGCVTAALASDLPMELQQHRGIYARMGVVKHRGWRREREKTVRKGHTWPMDLQALYFDQRYHNATTAQLWWDRHKFMFDVREQLTHFLKWRSRALLTRAVAWLRSVSSRRSGNASYVPESRGTGAPDAEMRTSMRKDTE